jgi:6-phosphogluconolactonase
MTIIQLILDIYHIRHTREGGYPVFKTTFYDSIKIVISYFLDTFKSREAPLNPIMSSPTSTNRIKIVNDAAEICRTAAGKIVHLTNRTATTAKPFTIALSGGSTPRGLHALMANEPTIRDGLPWQNLHFFWGDERHVPPDHPQSNYRMAYDTLLSLAPVPSENIHRVPAEEPDAALAAEKYEQELQAFFGLEAGQLPRFDCILLGMGPDGHTASLFPGTAALDETTRLVVANWVEKFKTYRITLTVPVLNHADLVVFLVSGAEKAEALKEVLQGEYRPDRFPAQLIRPGSEKLLWIVDQAAACYLSNGKSSPQRRRERKGKMDFP